MEKSVLNQFMEHKKNIQEGLSEIKGGRGSGNFGHSGRPGAIGGSGGGSGGSGYRGGNTNSESNPRGSFPKEGSIKINVEHDTSDMDYDTVEKQIKSDFLNKRAREVVQQAFDIAYEGGQTEGLESFVVKEKKKIVGGANLHEEGVNSRGRVNAINVEIASKNVETTEQIIKNIKERAFKDKTTKYTISYAYPLKMKENIAINY